MRALLLTAALLLATTSAAHAQTSPGVCAGLSASGPSTIREAAAEWVSLPCEPDFMSAGKGKGYGVRVSTLGTVAWLWCPNGTGWALRWSAIPASRTAALALDLPAALAAPDRRAALAQLGDDHLGDIDIASPESKALWCPHWAAMVASRPVVRWVVAKAAANAKPAGTRPAFPWANGVRGTVSNGRATQDTACDPAVGRLEGTTAYYGVNGNPAQVAVCVRAP
jgi:hypothetical protein